MNSREIYNEAEALRRAIEESKKETLPEGVGKKRSRSDSEEYVSLNCSMPAYYRFRSFLQVLKVR